MSQVRTDKDRLWNSHMCMAEIGALPGGGSCRLALSSDDKRGRDLFIEWCRDAGCEVRIDRMGNIFARRRGASDSLPAVSTGSHLDTQPHGGRFDGVYGVLAGLEVVQTLNDHGIETRTPFEVIVWTNEEGARFSPPLSGSAVFSRRIRLEEVHGCRTTDGTTVLEDLKAIGYWGDDISCADHDLACFIECHIEQGPMLERGEHQIGVVTSIQGLRAFRVTVTGVDSHAGTTPLELRKDALVGAAAMVVRLNEIGLSGDEATRITVGRFEVQPNSTSTVPGSVQFHIDARHPELATLDKLEARFGEELGALAEEAGLDVDIEVFLALEPTQFDPNLIEAICEVTEGLGYAYRKMPSGAGHDAMNLSAVTPTGMIFVPCAGGVSHNEAESASPEDLAAGADVLLHSLLRLSDTVAVK